MGAREYGDKYVPEMQGGFLGYGAKPTKYKLTNQLTFEGNALENIDPYLYLPDPSAPIHEPQKGSFVGWVTPSNYMNLLEGRKVTELMACSMLVYLAQL